MYIHIHLKYLYLYTFVHANSGSRCFFGGACRPLGSCNLPSPLRWKSWGLCTPRWAERSIPKNRSLRSGMMISKEDGRVWAIEDHFYDLIMMMSCTSLKGVNWDTWSCGLWKVGGNRFLGLSPQCVDTFVISITMHQVLQDLRQHVVQWLHRYHCTRLSQNICVLRTSWLHVLTFHANPCN